MNASKVFDADGSIVVGPSMTRCAQRVYVQIVGTGFTGTVNFKKSIAKAPYVTHAYRKDSDHTMAVADLTADAFVSLDSTGGSIEINVTVTAGSVEIFYWVGDATT